MTRTAKSASAVAVLMFALSVPVQAQNYKFDLGVNGGFGYWTDMLTDEQLGENTENIKFESGWLTGAQATFWFGPRFGLRLNGGYTERPLVSGSFDELDGNDTSTDVIGDINLWSASGDLMFKLGSGGKFSPFLALGLGAKFINPAAETFGTANDDLDGVAFAAGNDPAQVFLLQKTTKLMGLAALGGDVRLSPGLALRLEVGDRIFDSPIVRLTGTDPNFVADLDEDVGKVVHELYGTLGLHFLFGVERPQEVAIAPAPPPPAPAPEPTPPPAPARRDVSVCVVDPTAPGGIRTVTAFYLENAPADTLVTVNGSDVSLRTSTGNVMVASQAEWFTSGQPLLLTYGGQKTEFVTFGSSRLIEATDLAFIGTVRGLPVYADRAEVEDVREELAERARVGSNDIEKMLEEDRDLREDLSDIQVLYIPVQPTGCVFQPVQRVVEVRKSR